MDFNPLGKTLQILYSHSIVCISWGLASLLYHIFFMIPYSLFSLICFPSTAWMFFGNILLIPYEIAALVAVIFFVIPLDLLTLLCQLLWIGAKYVCHYPAMCLTPIVINGSFFFLAYQYGWQFPDNAYEMW